MGICRRTGKWILEEKIDPFGYADSVESLENFKKEFLAELNIPKSIGKEKNPMNILLCQWKKRNR